MPKATLPYFVQGASLSLTTTKGIRACVQVTSDGFSKPFPRSARIERIRLQIDTIAGGASSVVWNLAADADGDVALTPEASSTILTGKTTNTSGSVVILDTGGIVIPEANYVSGTIYVVARTNAGTCNMVPTVGFIL